MFASPFSELFVREIFVDVSERSGFWNIYASCRAEFSLIIKDSEFDLPYFSGLFYQKSWYNFSLHSTPYEKKLNW